MFSMNGDPYFRGLASKSAQGCSIVGSWALMDSPQQMRNEGLDQQEPQISLRSLVDSRSVRVDFATWREAAKPRSLFEVFSTSLCFRLWDREGVTGLLTKVFLQSFLISLLVHSNLC